MSLRGAAGGRPWPGASPDPGNRLIEMLRPAPASDSLGRLPHFPETMMPLPSRAIPPRPERPPLSILRHGRLLDRTARRAEPADILIRGDTIAEIGPPGLAAPEGAAQIDAADRMLIPGLVNAHTHGHGHLGKGMGDAWSLELLLNAGPYINGGRTEEDKELACLLGGLDMIRSGATACYDLMVEIPLPTLDGLAAAARGYAQAGLRVVLAPMVADISLYEAVPGLIEALPPALRRAVERLRQAPHAETLRILRSIAEGWSGDPDRARLALAPTIPLHCSDELILGCRDLAREHGLRLHMHLAESKVQAIAGLRRYGRTLTAQLAGLGFLGPELTAAHAIWLDADDIARLADAGVGVAHNPGSNLRLGSGVAPIREMRERGVTVGIGTDGSQCSDHQNMFEAMRLASFASRIRTPDMGCWIRTEEALAMATEGGAALLGLADRIGRIAPGFKADIVFLDLGSLSFVPLNDPVSQLVHSESGAAVDSVMIGGRLVYDRGRFTTVDIGALRRRVEARAAALRAQNATAERLARELEAALGRFCIGLARERLPIERAIPAA